MTELEVEETVRGLEKKDLEVENASNHTRDKAQIKEIPKGKNSKSTTNKEGTTATSDLSDLSEENQNILDALQEVMSKEENNCLY